MVQGNSVPVLLATYARCVERQRVAEPALNSKNALPREGGDWAPPAGLEPAAKRLEGAWRVRREVVTDLGSSPFRWQRVTCRRHIFDTARSRFTAVGRPLGRHPLLASC